MLAAFSSMPVSWRAVTQLVLQAAPHAWARRHLRRTLEHALEPERLERRSSTGTGGWSSVVLAAAFLAAVVVVPQLWALYVTKGWLPIALLALPAALGLAVLYAIWMSASERPLYDMELVKEKLNRPAARTELRLMVFAPVDRSHIGAPGQTGPSDRGLSRVRLGTGQRVCRPCPDDSKRGGRSVRARACRSKTIPRNVDHSRAGRAVASGPGRRRCRTG